MQKCNHDLEFERCANCNNGWNPKRPMPSIQELLDLLAKFGGQIVSTASLPIEFINQARWAGRMHVTEEGLGFVWEPPMTRIPQTDREVEMFEKWNSLSHPIPESLKDPSFLFNRKSEMFGPLKDE